jgi:LmbE family N-acetylglucosaminyl deacetylase
VATAIQTFGPDLVLFPMGAGGHVDHLALHAVAVAAADEGAAGRWFGFEDIPYAQFPWFAGWDAALGEAWSSTDHTVGEDAWSRKLEAIACYPSQLKAMFGEPAAWEELLATYARTLTDTGAPTERLWYRSSGSSA